MTRLFVTAVCLVTTIGIGTGVAEGRKKTATHVVKQGQTLWTISRSYGCDVEQLKEANDLGQSMIRVGQKLTIPACDGPVQHSAREKKGDSEQLVLTHYVVKGDSLGRIARRYDTTVKKIRRRNGLKNNIIRPGQKLQVEVGANGKGRAIKGQSVGSARSGKLKNGMQLPTGKSYHRRRPHRAWGTNHAIYHIRRVASLVRSRYPKVHKLSIGDISARKGGQLATHKSHQSGRDADIGFYYKKKPDGYPETFVKGSKSNLDLPATWALLQAFVETADSPSGVDKMFLDYTLQKVFYEYAKKRGVSRRKLDKWFQYPHGRGSNTGIIRDDPGHDSHVHVRFKCPKGDSGCRD